MWPLGQRTGSVGVFPSRSGRDGATCLNNVENIQHVEAESYIGALGLIEERQYRVRNRNISLHRPEQP